MSTAWPGCTRPTFRLAFSAVSPDTRHRGLLERQAFWLGRQVFLLRRCQLGQGGAAVTEDRVADGEPRHPDADPLDHAGHVQPRGRAAGPGQPEGELQT
jgi:hypothetical protein